MLGRNGNKVSPGGDEGNGGKDLRSKRKAWQAPFYASKLVGFASIS